MCPLSVRQEAWKRLDHEIDRDRLAAMTSEIGLADVIESAGRILKGDVRGRLVVKVG
jgi:acrylyl-CoA reductase (NADPH)